MDLLSQLQQAGMILGNYDTNNDSAILYQPGNGYNAAGTRTVTGIKASGIDPSKLTYLGPQTSDNPIFSNGRGMANIPASSLAPLVSNYQGNAPQTVAGTTGFVSGGPTPSMADLTGTSNSGNGSNGSGGSSSGYYKVAVPKTATNPGGYDVYDAQGNHLTLAQTQTLGPNGGPLNITNLPVQSSVGSSSGTTGNNTGGTGGTSGGSNTTGTSAVTYFKVPVTVTADNPGGFDVYDSNGNKLTLDQSKTLGPNGGPLNIDALPVQQLTGDPSLNSILGNLSGLISSNKAVIPAGMQITPALTQQFLAWAHQVVDPQTQQLLNQHIIALNSNLAQAETDYQNQQAGIVQDFGTNLASTDNSMAGSGVAFSGLRNLTDTNLANTANRSLSSLSADTQNSVGQALNTAAAQVGSANTNQFNLPNLLGGSVALAGGSRGSFNPSGALNYNYNPNAYAMGTDLSTGNTNVANQEANYLSQYGTLAANNSGRSMSSLIGGVTGLPSGYQIPTNLS